MTELAGTRYAQPVVRRTQQELDERLRWAVRSEYSTLVLCADAAAAAVCARRLTGTLARMAMPAGGLSGPVLALDASGLNIPGFCRAVYAALGSELDWPPAPEPVEPLFAEFGDGMDGLEVMRACSERLAELRCPGGRRASRRVVAPTLLVWGVEPETAWIFAAWRDQLWGVEAPWVVCAPEADKNRYLLTYSDSFFFGGGIHRAAQPLG